MFVVAEDFGSIEYSQQEIGQFADAIEEMLVDEFPAMSYELEAKDAIYQNGFSRDDKNELMRIANSKWGRRLIKVFFRLRLNKLLR